MTPDKHVVAMADALAQATWAMMMGDDPDAPSLDLVTVRDVCARSIGINLQPAIKAVFLALVDYLEAKVLAEEGLPDEVVQLVKPITADASGEPTAP